MLRAHTPLAAAARAWALVQLALAVTARARAGDREKTVSHAQLAASTAGVARRAPCAGLGTRARARLAALEARHLDLRVEAQRGVFERDLQLVLEVLASRGAAAAAPAATREAEALEEIGEEAAEVGLEVHRARLRGAEAIVLSAAVGIGQNAVRLLRLLEALLGLLVALVAVGMVLHRQLTEGLLDVRLARAAPDTEDLVVIARHYATFSSGAAATVTSAGRSTRPLSR